MNCPLCNCAVEILFARNKASKMGKKTWWRIAHARFPSDCKLRYENLGEGETPEEAWKSFRYNLQHDVQSSSQLPS